MMAGGADDGGGRRGEARLVDEEHAGHELGDPLVDVLVDDLVDLTAQLLGDLRLLRLHHLPHHRRQILPALRLSVGQV